MKTHFFALAFFILALTGCAKGKAQAFIEVTGSAEMTIIPDDIELEIVLVNPSSQKSSVEALDKIFFDALNKHHIPLTSVSFVSIDSPYYWYSCWWDSKNYSNTKTYKLRLNLQKHNFAFINDIKPDYIRNIRITQSQHSKITEYRRQVKIEAIKAAQEKASDLLEAIGQKAGKVIEVIELSEPDNSNYWWNRYYASNPTSNCVVSPNYDNNLSDNGSNVPVIKLRFEIKAKFEIV